MPNVVYYYWSAMRFDVGLGYRLTFYAIIPTRAPLPNEEIHIGLAPSAPALNKEMEILATLSRFRHLLDVFNRKFSSSQ